MPITPVWDLKSQYDEYKEKEVFDCLLAEYILCEGRRALKLETTLHHYGVKTLTELYEKQKAELEKNPKFQYLYQEIEYPLVKVLYQMEKHGIRIDREQLHNLREFLDKEIEKISAKIYDQAGMQLNLASPKQVGEMLVQKFTVPLKKKAASGSYSTNEQDLMQFAAGFPIITDILKFREYAKLRSTYIESLLDKIASDGRIHTTYNQAGAVTGRLSSANPNLQNIPVTSEVGKQIKECFIADTDYNLISFDYSQQELRILAHMSQEEKLIQAFKEGRDIHKTTATQLFDVTYDNVTKRQRSVAKTINFGLIYGMSSYGLSLTLQITPEEAESFISTFFNNFPKIKQFFDGLLSEGKKQDYIETLLGRRRFVFPPYLPKGVIDNASRRILINFPIQGSAADLIKKAMGEIEKEILPNYPQVKMLLQIHDELVFEIPENITRDSFIHDVKRIMMSSYNLAVPMEVETKIGKNWGEMKPLA
jgi:DNA polymerase-1